MRHFVAATAIKNAYRRAVNICSKAPTGGRARFGYTSIGGAYIAPRTLVSCVHVIESYASGMLPVRPAALSVVRVRSLGQKFIYHRVNTIEIIRPVS